MPFHIYFPAPWNYPSPSAWGHERAKRVRLFKLSEGHWFCSWGHSQNRPCGVLFPLSLSLSLCTSPLSCLLYLFTLIFSFFSLSQPSSVSPFSPCSSSHITYLLALDIFLFLRPSCDIAKFCGYLVSESSRTQPERFLRDKITVWGGKNQKMTTACTHICEQTHTYKHTAGTCLYYTTRNPWSRRQGDRDNKSPALLKSTGAVPFVPCISSSFIHLSPQILPTGSAELVFFTTHSKIQKYVTFLQILYFDMTFLQSRISVWESQGAHILPYLFDSHVSVLPSQAAPGNCKCWHPLIGASPWSSNIKVILLKVQCGVSDHKWCYRAMFW